MMQYYNLIVNTSEIENKDNLIALIDLYTEYECILEENDALIVSYNMANHTISELEKLLKDSKILDDYTIEEVENKNWNEVFESSFEPIVSRDKHWGIRASFHKPLDVEVEIQIDPKMSFGTGHHETTYQMMEMMRLLDFSNKSVWDYGSGTGVLAIMASMSGASTLVANDVEEGAYRNSLENIKINNCNNIAIHQGTIVDLEGTQTLNGSTKFDIILANITKNILLHSALKIDEYSNTDSDLLLSGFFEYDIEDILLEYQKIGFVEQRRTTNNNWACLYLKKNIIK